MVGLLDRIGYAFQVNWHSAGQWLLYAEGWQTSTPTADDPIYYAMSGNLDDPAIDGFHPGLSSDVLYVTNGETTDYAHATTGALAWTPELSEGCDGCGFVFPDDEALVEEEFQRNLPFAMSVARSAVDPVSPKTVTGITTKPFYVDSDDPSSSQPQWLGKLRLGSTPSPTWIWPSPLLSRRFFRHSRSLSNVYW